MDKATAFVMATEYRCRSIGYSRTRVTFWMFLDDFRTQKGLDRMFLKVRQLLWDIGFRNLLIKGNDYGYEIEATV